MSASHELKSWPRFFHAIVTGDRRHELSLLFNLCRLFWHGSPVLSGVLA